MNAISIAHFSIDPTNVLLKNGSRRTTVSEKYIRYASKEITVFTVSGNGAMAIGYITSVFLHNVI